MSGVNGYTAGQPISGTIPALFDEIAARYPGAIAVTCDGSIVTYHELAARSDALARMLIARGARPDEFIGCCIDRSVDLIVALVAILKAGGAYVPLDPAYPDERLGYMLADTSCRLIVSEATSRDRLAALTGAAVVTLDEVASDTAVSAPPPDVSPRSAAYVMYTSGSTGKPRGVVVEHRSIIRLVRETNFCDFGPDQVWLHAAPLAFDASTLELWGPLLNGGRLVVAPPRASLDDLGRLIRTERVTSAWFTSGLFNLMVEQRLADMGSLRQLLAGGDVLSPRHVRMALEGLPGCTLINGYGPTENTTFTTCHVMRSPAEVEDPVPIGRPISHTTVYVLDETLSPVADGEVGELYTGGAGVARGYLNDPETTAARFLPDPFSLEPGALMYKTSDLVRRRGDGPIRFIGRADNQIKILGHRIEPGEIEAVLNAIPGIGMSCVVVDKDDSGAKRLIAYYIANGTDPTPGTIRTVLAEKLPRYMMPALVMPVCAMPLTHNGKIDRTALPRPVFETRRKQETRREALGLEQVLHNAWCEHLGSDSVGLDDNFFDIGGDSLRLVALHADLERRLGREIPIVDLFEFTTLRQLARHLRGAKGDQRDTGAAAERASSQRAALTGTPAADRPRLEGIAIVGLAGRFPGADSVAEFWKNQLAGLEKISHFTVDELEIADKAAVAGNDGYVRARSVLDNVEMFDADFFGIMAREAQVMDPQQRLFLEVCWQAIEDAGYDPANAGGTIGVYGGCSVPTYLLARLCKQPGFIDRFTEDYQVGSFQELIGNGSDFFATRVAYKLDLRGPSLTLQTACSTSLVAVAHACQALMTHQCDMALAGGVSISFPQKRGTNYLEGGMTSPDGTCRTFDADANGTVFGSGGGAVLLKRLDAAIRDGDHVYAVIRGFGLSNDGSEKIGYTAPSVAGQARAISAALGLANIEPDTIGYIEAHGTATPLGDPIELTAVSQVYRQHTDRKQYCTIGTAKTNIGHLDVAAGVTGLINAVNIVHHGILPPTLHFKAPNPKFDLAGSPFKVNTSLTPWPAQGHPRRAGVSAFGVGGTNCHVIIEQAPAAPEPARSASDTDALVPELLVLSARTPTALAAMKANLAERLRSDQALELADVAHTLQVGRRRFQTGASILVHDRSSAIEALEGRAGERVQERAAPIENPAVTLLFPGQGAQHVGMGRGLYEREPRFAATIDTCAEILLPLMAEDLRTVLYPADPTDPAAQARLTDTRLAQPALFALEVALARLWISYGIEPAAMIGHSVGEFAAACISGVFSLEAGLKMVAARGSLMQEVAPGAMLSLRMSRSEVEHRIAGTGLSIAAANAPQMTVVAGPIEAIDQFEHAVKSERIACRRLVTSHAFHSSMMDPVLDRFRAIVSDVSLEAPCIPIISTVTGGLLTAEQACDPEYWVRHLRETVDYSAAIATVRGDQTVVLLEVGPSNTLGTLALQHDGADQVVAASLPGPQSEEGDQETLLQSVGTLWLAGVPVDWRAVRGATRRRVALPTYPFERRYYAIEAPQPPLAQPSPAAATFASPSTAVANASPASSADLEPAPMTTSQTSAADARRTRIEARLVEVIEGLSGQKLAGLPRETTFLEMGFDSLFLTQVTRELKKAVDLKVTFRQLLSQQNSFAKLAEYAEGALPATAFADGLAPAPAPAVGSAAIGTTTIATAQAPVPAQATVAVAPSPVAVPAPIATATPSAPVAMVSAPMPAPVQFAAAPDGASAMERLMRDQLQVMSQLFTAQIGAMSGAPATIIHIPQQQVTLQQPAVPQVAVVPQQPAAAPAQIAPPPPVHVAAPVAAPHAAPAATDAKEFKAFGPYKPIQAKMAVELSAEQRANIAALVDRYSRRHATSKSITETYRGVLADPRVVSGFREDWKEMVFPVTVNRSKGSKLWDVDGNELIDILNGFGPIMFGHRPEFVERAVERQLHEGFEVGPQTPLAGEIAKLFCEVTGNERMTFCNTGSEAVMAAMRVARTVTGRDRILMFTGDYHGMFDEVLVKASRNASGEPCAAPIAPGIPNESVANIVVLEYGTPQTLEWIRANANDLAAVIVEPVQSRRPSFRPVEFLKEVRQITAAAGTALVFDEVVTGFRTHPGGCQALFDIRADMATYGKVAGGGMPIGILAGRAEFMDALDGGQWRFGDMSVPEIGVTFFAGTFVRHPIALAGVKAILEKIKAEGPELQTRLGVRTEAMLARINAVLERYAIPTRLANFTSFFFFSFPPEERLASLFYAMLRENGVHALEGFPCFLTTEHTDADIDRVVSAFETAAREMRRCGFLLTPLPDGFVLPADARPGAAPTGPAATSAIEVPLTEPQREIFFAAMMGQDVSCAFNESFTLHLVGDADLNALEASLQALALRHEALRSVVSADGAQLIITATRAVPVTRVDLSGLTADDAEQRYGDLLAEDARTPFDLHKGPLVRASIVSMPGRRTSLVISAHHIVCDGWSVNVMLDDLARLYSEARGESGVSLEPVISYSAFARSQQAFRTSDEFKRNEAYWTGRFTPVPSPLDLPLDRPRQDVRTYNGDTLRRRIAAGDYQSIKALGSRHGVSLFATLFAGFAALVSRLSSHSDVVVGIPMAGQQNVDDGVLVGHCVNFLPLRIDAKPSARFLDLMTTARDVVLDAHEHQEYTYGTLIDRLGVRRDPVRLPLTELQFNVEQIGAGLTFKGLDVRVEPNPKSAVNSDLFLNIVEQPDGLDLDCDYNTDLYDEATIDGWLTAFRSLLLAAVAAPETSVDALLLPAGTRQLATRGAVATAAEIALIAGWNETAASYPRDAAIHQLFEAEAAAAPDRTALAIADRTMTYGALDRRANQIARELVACGVRPGDRVACCIQRSFDLVAGILAILKTGSAFVPVDPALPRERLEFILADTSVSVMLSTSAVPLPDLKLRRIDIDAEASNINRHASEPLGVSVRPDDLAYIMYTSGSTGRPKGVMVAQRAVIRLVKGTNYCSFGPDTAFLVNAPISFDASTFEIWGALLNGGRAVLMPPGDPSLADLGRVIRDGGVTTAFLTTGLFHVMAEQQIADLGHLRELFTGGEVLSPRLMQRLIDECPATRLVAVYGPTEGTTFTTFHPFAPGAKVPASVPIGKPIANARTYVLGDDMEPLPVGTIGELYIAGDGLSHGYLNLPAATTERFIEATIGGKRERLYRTGDQARYLPDGTLEFHGRIDGQIKLRGFRIETGEIESALEQHPAVVKACVLPEIDQGRVTRLIAFCIGSDGAPVDDEVVRHYMQGKLPAYMVPSAIVPVAEFPLNVNGKIDRQKLLDIERTRRATSSFTAPETPAEKTLCDIVVEVMQVPRVGVTDNLFELGVDSLRIFQITSRATKAGLSITPRMVLQARTIRDILLEADKAPAAPVLTRINIKPVARQRQPIDSRSSKRVS